MAQHDYVIDNGPGLAVRTDINAALAAIQSSNSGTVEPAAKVPGQFWFNTTTGQLLYRNTGNTAWAPVTALSVDGLSLFLKEGTVNRGSVIAAGGADAGTIALRAYNNAGVEVGSFWLNSTSIGTNKQSFILSGNAHKFIYLQTAAGLNQGVLLYNWDSNMLEFRVYDAAGSAVSNDIAIDRGGGGSTRSTIWTWNAGNKASDADNRFRVGGSRAMRWYYAQNGDIFLQESDDLFASHFINVLTYSRGSNNVNFPNYAGASGFYVNGGWGSNNGLFLGTGDGAVLSTYNIMLRSWNGIGFPAATDGVNRFTINCRTGSTIMETSGAYSFTSGTAFWSDGNIQFTGGMTAWGATLHAALTNINNAAISNPIYTGTDSQNTNYPIGSYLSVRDLYPIDQRNVQQGVTIASSLAGQFVVAGVAGGGTALAGTWSTKGVTWGDGSVAMYLMQRIS